MLTVAAVSYPGEADLIGRMYTELPEQIALSITNTQLAKSSSPHLGPFLDAQLEALVAPGLAQAIVAREQAVSRSIPSLGGLLPVAVVYLTPEMRPRAERVLDIVAQALPLAESFFARRFPADKLRIWYGFVIGSNSAITIEDEALYGVRPPTSKNPYDGIA
ncbi:hypothetical protein WDZ92_20525, partial [Nostoc sp. NIES-2111]